MCATATLHISTIPMVESLSLKTTHSIYFVFFAPPQSKSCLGLMGPRPSTGRA